jgi:fluoride exporter
VMGSVWLVGIGSAVGALSRYGIGQWLAKVNRSPFPWGTWLMNVMGTWLFGVLAQLLTVRYHHPFWWLLSGTGFCGGFTTFSTMSVESVVLFRRDPKLAILYLASSLALGLFFAWTARWWF